jgi:hypothetical protein
MHSNVWTESEKKIAHRVYESALQRELAEIIEEFKTKAANVKTPEDMWAVQKYLERSQREIEEKYDYRYSQLILIFGRLLREGRIEEDDLKGMAEDKLADIRRVANL